MNNKKRASKLLEWYKKNLIASADLKKEDIANYFAENFLIKANERTHEGNYENYFAFLNTFRETIKSIDYDTEEFICSEDKVVIPLKATVIRTNGKRDFFQAIMILGFNQMGKVMFWQEVYVPF